MIVMSWVVSWVVIMPRPLMSRLGFILPEIKATTKLAEGHHASGHSTWDETKSLREIGGAYLTVYPHIYI